MPYDPQQVIIGGEGAVYLAPKGTAGPVDSDSPLNAAFTELGIFSEDSGAIILGREINDILGHKAPYPVRKVEASRSASFGANFRQWFRKLIETAFNGTVDSPSAGEYRLRPNASGLIVEHAVVVQWRDFGYDFRYYQPSCVVTENVEIPLRRTENAVLPLTFGVTDPGTGIDAYNLFSDFPGFAP